MNISSISYKNQQYQYKKGNNPNFTSTFPIVHWVAESNGSYSPVLGMDLVKKLQRKLISFLNKPETGNKLSQAEEKVRHYLKLCDKDFRRSFGDNDVQRVTKIRSFYDRIENESATGYRHNAFAITGIDIDNFEYSLAKKIGKEKGHALRKLGTTRSADAKIAIQEYLTNGLNFVNNPNKRIYDLDGVPCVLHTKFEIVRNKAGKIKGYNFVDARFLPEHGPKNPFERIKNG